jgi:Rad3-related DNA helicases
MAARVAQALEEEQHLIVEAGTGVGKSLGYLVPSSCSRSSAQKAIVSTHTINLQEQLLHKDIPILKKVLPSSLRQLDERPAKLSVPAPARASVAKRAGTFYRPGAERIAAVGRMGAHYARWIAQRSVRRTRIQKFGRKCAAKRISAPKDLWPGSACFYQQARKRLLART